MKKYFLLFICIITVHLTIGQQNVGVGTATPDASAKLEVSSTTQGMLVPRMTTAQRIAISNPASGLLVFDMTTNSFWFRGGSSWVQLVDSVHTEVHRSASNMIYTGLTDNVGVGTITPGYKLQVKTGEGYGISHTNGTVDVATYIQNDAGGFIGTKSNHPFTLYANDGINQFVLTPTGNVGIGKWDPHAPLQFNGVTQNRKIVLFEGINNDHQFFGLGVNPNILRYQVSNINDNHVFYAGTSSSSSDELMRIQGNGNVGIGIPLASNKLDIQSGLARTGTHAAGRPLYVTGNLGPNSSGIEFRQYNGTQGIGFGYNTIYAAGSDADQNLGIQAKGAAGNLLFSTNGNERMRVTGDGRVGIGVTNPDATLDIARGTGAMALKIKGTYYDSWFNVGDGDWIYIRGGKPNANVILADASGQNVGIGQVVPLQRLHVDGNIAVNNYVGIGNTDPHAPLHFNNGDLNKKIILDEFANNDHQFTGLGENAGDLRYQVPATNAKHVFYAAASASSSNELMRITGEGRVGIGVTSPSAMLEITRGTAPTGSLQINGTTYASHFSFGDDEDTYIRGGKAGGKVIINDYGDFGNVGIGTDTPLQKLHVGGSVAVDGNVGIGIATPLQNRLDIQSEARTGSHATGRALYVTGGIFESSNGVEFRHTNGTQGIGFGYNTIYATGSDASQNLGILARGATGNVILSTNGNERMRITGEGRVGIGVTNPDATLEITRGTAPYGTLQLDGTNYNSHFNYGTEENTYIRGGKPGAKVIINEYGNPGNVGIGTANPTEKLGVEGNAIISGALKIGYYNTASVGVNVNGISFGSASCNCDAGYVVLGGGFSSSNNGIDTIQSRPNGNSSWFIYFYNRNAFAVTIQAYAVCARLAN